MAQRLEYQYRSPRRAHTLQEYPAKFFEQPLDELFDEISDWWADKRYNTLRREGFFQHKTDIALAIYYDGVQAIDQTSHSIAPIILINYNLPPSIRYQQRNILCSMLMPGPKEPKDLSSFLRPLVNELIELGKGIKVFDARFKRDILLKAYAVIAGGKSTFFSEFF